MNRRVTIADVAQAAGVSSQTVSRAINDKSEISPETRQRILEIAHRLGFRPNHIARSLVRQQTTTIGIVIPDITNPFFSEIVRGVEDAARAHDYNVFLCNTDKCPSVNFPPLIRSRKTGGRRYPVFAAPEEADLLAPLQELPYSVLINRTQQKAIAARTRPAFDDQAGACAAVAHLF